MTLARAAAKETKRIQTECLYFQLDRHKATIIKLFPVFNNKENIVIRFDALNM